MATSVAKDAQSHDHHTPVVSNACGENFLPIHHIEVSSSWRLEKGEQLKHEQVVIPLTQFDREMRSEFSSDQGTVDQCRGLGVRTGR